MAIHSGIKDDGAIFQVIPPTRKILVPPTHRVVGTVGSHNSEQLTFMCPTTIDDHDVTACAGHYIDWVNADGQSDRYTVKDIIIEGENMYFAWVIDSSVTVAAGFIKFSVHFEDRDENGALLYEWGTTECSECQILGTVRRNSGTPVTVPEGYVKPEGNLDIEANGEYQVATFNTVRVAVPTGLGMEGLYVGSDTPPDSATVWIDPSGDATSTEEWKFEMVDGNTVKKTVVVTESEG